MTLLHRFISVALSISLLIVATLGSALHELGGAHTDCGDSAELHSHNGIACSFPHVVEDSCCPKPEGSDREVPNRRCEDGCAVCVLLAQSLQNSNVSIEVEGHDFAAQLVAIGNSPVVVKTIRLASPRGPPVV